MRSIQFLPKASKQYAKLEPSIQKLIKKKMVEYPQAPDPFVFAKRLIAFEYGEYRFRIGDYRVICDRDEDGKMPRSIGIYELLLFTIPNSPFITFSPYTPPPSSRYTIHKSLSYVLLMQQ